VKELIEEKPGVLDREFSYEQAFQRGLYCKGEIEVNLAGEWKERFEGPLWVITNLGPAEGLRIYKARMKIDEGFNDLKSLLNLERVMNKKHEQMEKVVALVLLAYAIGLLVGGAIRDQTYGGNGGRSGETPYSRQPGTPGKRGEVEALLCSICPAQPEDSAGTSGDPSAHHRGARVLQDVGLG
jgi:hypothetical protein